MSSKYCHHCGKTINGGYVSAMGYDWHMECFRCAHCKKAFDESGFYEQDGKPYCKRCHLELFASRCDVCGGPIEGRYITNAWGNKYCDRHEGEVELCSCCGRPICQRLTNGGYRYDDGRHICALCRRSAVDTGGQVERVVADVVRRLEGAGCSFPSLPPFRLVERGRLGSGAGAMGQTKKRVSTFLGRETGREVEAIHVLYGLPRWQFASVAAHELGHAWLFLNRYPNLEKMHEEGICELFAHLWLAGERTLESDFELRNKSRNPDPVYGDGYRRALGAYERIGLDRLLGHVRSHGRLP